MSEDKFFATRGSDGVIQVKAIPDLAAELHRTRPDLETFKRRHSAVIEAGRDALQASRRAQVEANKLRAERDLWRLLATIAVGGAVLIAGICISGAL